ncbi:hypothetical protein C9426_32715 [Serratia sp. S1B]|nr:hypothetical protein C9426_32715 [Serratia sp. S1B]
MSVALLEVARHFQLLRLHITLQLTEDTQLPAFKGSMWHGWLGQALKAVDERVYATLYGQHAVQQPKPYVICPNEDLKKQWCKYELLSFELLLIGEAASLAPRVLEALEYGQILGLGEQRTPAVLLSVCSQLPGRYRPGLHPTLLAEWLYPQPTLEPIEVALQLQTPMRWKFNGQIQQPQAFPLDVWIRHIQRRIKLLGTFWVADQPELYNRLYLDLPRMSDYEVQHYLYFEDWQRYSAVSDGMLPFGGVKGQISYQGEISEVLPWLQAGEVLHLGGKTTFGLGKYRLLA